MTTTLHTKFRPQTFTEVIGQDTVVRSFREALKKGTSHAFLFHGPTGTGKTTLSRLGAYTVGCTERELLEIDAATFTGIDDMRVVTSGLSYRPLGGGNKSVIVDECHALSAQAWKSLLKSIEEPPSYVYWFLCTTELNKVPETIRTRCTRYELQPVSTDALFDLLLDVANREKLPISEAVVELCAKQARGSPRQALVNLGACAGAKEEKDARSLLRAVEGSAGVIDLCRALVERKDFLKVVLPILNDLKDQNAESVRQVVRDYMTKVVLGSKSEKAAGGALEVLDEFSTPFPSGDGISPVVMACARILLG